MNLKTALALLAVLGIGAFATLQLLNTSPRVVAGHEEDGDHHDHHDHHDHEEQEEHPMRTVITADAAKRAGVVVEKAGPADLPETLTVYGHLEYGLDKIARVTARFSGVIVEVKKTLGDPVQAGEILARVQTNGTLATLEVKSPLSGVIVERHGAPGESIAEGAAIFTVADPSEIHADLEIPVRELSRVKLGNTVVVRMSFGEEIQGVIEKFSPTVEAASQTLEAHVPLPNPQGRLRPGASLKAVVTLGSTPAAVTVKASAIQTLGDRTVVFARQGEAYLARPVETGRRSGETLEVLKGLDAGEEYVSQNSFLIKADIGKAEAAHEH